MKKVNIELKERDWQILRGLLESRIMTAEHMSVLYFDGKREAAKKRLQKLKTTGYITVRRGKVNEPAILSLSMKGISLLKSNRMLNEYPMLEEKVFAKRSIVSEQTIRHELAVMDVKTAFHTKIKAKEGFSLAEFSTWPLLYQFETERDGYAGAEVLVKPDGFIRIHENETDGGLSEHSFFLEVDRSTETLDTLVTRAGCYLNYYRSGGFAERCGGNRSHWKEYPFRVLMVFKTAERRNNMAERLLLNNPPILTQCYLSTIEEVTKEPFGAIWIRPVDYREAVKGTPYEPKQIQDHWGYQRRTAREVWVENRVKMNFCV